MKLLGKIGMLLKDKITITEKNTGYAWVNKVYEVLEPMLWAIMAVVGAAGAIYAIILGVNLARAEDQSKRDEAKKRMIWTLLAIALTILLVVFFNTILPLIINAAADGSYNPTAMIIA